MIQDPSAEQPNLSPSSAHLLGEIMFTMNTDSRTAKLDLSVAGSEDDQKHEIEAVSDLVGELFDCTIKSTDAGTPELIRILESSNIEGKLLAATLTEKFVAWSGSESYRKLFELTLG